MQTDTSNGVAGVMALGETVMVVWAAFIAVARVVVALA
jgi:hypothetical protein